MSSQYSTRSKVSALGEFKTQNNMKSFSTKPSSAKANSRRVLSPNLDSDNSKHSLPSPLKRVKSPNVDDCSNPEGMGLDYTNLHNAFSCGNAIYNGEDVIYEEDVHHIPLNDEASNREAEPPTQGSVAQDSPRFVPVEVKNSDGSIRILYDYAIPSPLTTYDTALQATGHALTDPNEYIRKLEERNRNAETNESAKTHILCSYTWPIDADTRQDFKVTEKELARINNDTLMRTQIGHILLAKCDDAALLKTICLGKPKKEGHRQIDPEWWAIIKGFYGTKYEDQLQSGDAMFKSAFWRGVRCSLEDGLKGKRNHCTSKEADSSEASTAKRQAKKVQSIK